jgi:TRAP-type mannitol/chloroaromatic compound transport system permease large subunit
VSRPAAEADGYDLAMTCGSIAAGGTLGIHVPVSIVMIIYDLFRASVAKRSWPAWCPACFSR